MVAGEDVRARPPADGLVSAPAGEQAAPGRRDATGPRVAAATDRQAAPVFVRLVMLLAAAALLAGILGGLLRAGALDAELAGVPPLGAALVAHAALMICAFFGTVIGIERAVALKRSWAFLAPLLAGTGGIAILLGEPVVAHGLFAAAASVFVVVSIVVVAKQRAAHTLLLLVAALAWLIGNGLQLLQPGTAASIGWWFGFLVVTIAAERLELTRLMPRRPGSGAILVAGMTGLIAGAAWAIVAPGWGGALFGASLVVLAGWGLAFDIARRTILMTGASRYMAACLLAGYGWLGIGGLAWIATSLGQAPAYDMAVHAIGLGFVFDMVMAHALVILPAVAKIRLAYRPVFYLGFGLMQASLALRLFGAPLDHSLQAVGSALNAVAILVFALTIVGVTLATRRAGIR